MSISSVTVKLLIEEQFANRNSHILWLMISNIHYNRTTTLEKREKVNALWTSGSKQAQIAEEVGLSPQTVHVSNIVVLLLC